MSDNQKCAGCGCHVYDCACKLPSQMEQDKAVVIQKFPDAIEAVVRKLILTPNGESVEDTTEICSSNDMDIVYGTNWADARRRVEEETGKQKVMTGEDIMALSKDNHRCGWTTGAVKNLNPECGCMCGTVYNAQGEPILSHGERHSGVVCKCFPQPGQAAAPEQRPTVQITDLEYLELLELRKLAPTSPNAEREQRDQKYYKLGFNVGRKIGFREGVEAAAKVADDHAEKRRNSPLKFTKSDKLIIEKCAIQCEFIAIDIRALTPALPVEDGKEN